MPPRPDPDANKMKGTTSSTSSSLATRYRALLPRASSASIIFLGVVTVWLLIDLSWRPVILLLIGACGLAGARVLSERGSLAVPMIVVSLLGVALLLDAKGTLSAGATAGPLGYANAKAALYAQGAIAAGIIGFRARSRRMTLIAGCAATVFALVPLVSRSLAAALALCGVVALQFVPRRLARVGVMGCGLVFTLVLATSLLIASGAADSPELLNLDERRLALWRDAWNVMADSPAWGAGEGVWIETSVVASADADASWVHNEFLELGAEDGVPTLLLAASLVGWLLVSFARVAQRDARMSLLGAGAVTMFAVHACVDYVGHFALVPVVTALVAGTALGVARQGAYPRSLISGDEQSKSSKPLTHITES